MKQLPNGFYREPVVAWVIGAEKRSGNFGFSDVLFHGGLVPNLEFCCDHVEVSRFSEKAVPVPVIIPAFPNCFAIIKSDIDPATTNEVHTYGAYCYEVNGVFTDHVLDEQMKNQPEEKEMVTSNV